MSHCDVLCHRRDTSAKWDEGHYLPHRPVVKESGTTRMRPVFDVSARERGKPSLNQCLEKGVNLIAIIPAILVRVRINQIGIIAAIRKTFLQIRRPEFPQVFLWVNKEGDLKIFRHAQVAFGVNSSSFSLGEIVDFHLKKYSEGSEVATEYTRSTTEKVGRVYMSTTAPPA